MGKIAPPRPLEPDELEKLLDHLDVALQLSGCDNTLRHTHAFLSASGQDLPGVTRWLQRCGGYCDCEVLMNVGG